MTCRVLGRGCFSPWDGCSVAAAVSAVFATLAELVDAADSKSATCLGVRVRFPRVVRGARHWPGFLIVIVRAGSLRLRLHVFVRRQPVRWLGRVSPFGGVLQPCPSPCRHVLL